MEGLRKCNLGSFPEEYEAEKVFRPSSEKKGRWKPAIKGIRLTNCTLKLKKDTRLQIVNPIPAKFGLVRRPAAALKAPLSGACARFSSSI
jgi:hypothetical protein